LRPSAVLAHGGAAGTLRRRGGHTSGGTTAEASQATSTPLMARLLASLLPELTPADAIETTPIPHVAGLTGARAACVTTRPFRAPHHPISDVGLIGGGQVPQPGEVSLAHHGVLVLDELSECRRHVLEVRRQPLEESIIYRQSPARPGAQCYCGLRYTAHELKPLGQRTVATHRNHGGSDVRCVTASLLHPSI
jgi:Magnesium chelatase, subunit ChlI